jgi:hypothetical protein
MTFCGWQLVYVDAGDQTRRRCARQERDSTGKLSNLPAAGNHSSIMQRGGGRATSL